jgi:RNA polymerase sigma factor (sigma-70 family)
MNDEDFNHRLTELRPRLHRYCGRMVGSTVDGEDVLQETLLKAIRARAADPPVDNIESWIFRIAHNTSIDFLRERQRKATISRPHRYRKARLLRLAFVPSCSCRNFSAAL